MRFWTILALFALTAPVAAEEPMAVGPRTEFTPREDVVLPAPQPVRFKGRAYTARFVPEGGFGYTRAPDGTKGQFWADLFLVGGAENKMQAVAVYMKLCHGSGKVVDAWGDEVVPKLEATGEYAFMYPDDCAAWRASNG